MYATGELTPMPIAAIFADTHDEPKSVYTWLDWLETQFPFPLHRVGRKEALSASSLTPRVTSDGRIYSTTNVPVYTLNADGTQGAVRMRSCTRDFKIRPILKMQRKLLKVERGCKEVCGVSVIGISLDEFRRVKPSRDKWIVNRHPLVEMRMTRQHCLDWMAERGFGIPPRSACWHCPFHSPKEWRRMQLEEPEEFAKAVQFERDLQALKSNSDNFASIPFLHSSCKPLDQIDFRSDVEHGQQLLWDDECEGMCGV
jgi:hypothetical protein